MQEAKNVHAIDINQHNQVVYCSSSSMQLHLQKSFSNKLQISNSSNQLHNNQQRLHNLKAKEHRYLRRE